jgi:GDPmannose 4,6-dehydratase
VRDFCEAAFRRLGLDYERYVRSDARFMRAADIEILAGDPSKARSVLGWEPKVGFNELVDMMVDEDLERLSR